MDPLRLRPLVPRLTVQWAHEPDRSWKQLPGSMLFADISGFTRLAEQLAVHGPAGAEELNDLINVYFEAIIAAAERYGGDVLKFGGDAVLVWFDGDGHEQRVCAASLGMQAAIVRPITRRDGRPVRLRMSVGAHTGEFTFLMTVGRSRELFVGGPAASEVMRCESIANAGQVLLSAELAAAVPAKWLGGRVDERRLLRRRVEVPPWEAPALLPTPTDLTDFVPAAQRELVAAGAPGEHRHAAIAFVDVPGTDDLLASEGPEALTALMQRVAEATEAATSAWGTEWLSTDLGPNGLKLMLTGGVPTSLGHDEDRMLRTMCQLKQECADVGLRIGVHRGRVYCGFVGATWRRGFTVVGDAVNLSARLMQHAGRGEMVASRVALDWADSHYDETPLAPFFVKNKTNPVEASIVHRLAGRKPKGEAHDLPLIGRERELAQLEERAERARRGSGSALVAQGDQGIGKSRLMIELARRQPDLATLTVSADEYSTTTPHALVRTVLRNIAECPLDADPATAGAHLAQWVAATAPSELPWLPLLALPFGAEVPPTRESDELAPPFRAAQLRRTTAAVVARAVRNPTLLVIDDAQWVDEASADLLAEVFRGVETRPWLVCILVSGAALPEWLEGIEQLDIRPLTSEQTAELAAEAATGRIARPALEHLAERSGGNPLFLVNLVDATNELGDPESLPGSVETLITRRIDDLDVRDRMLLREASVAGMEIDLPLLSIVLGERLVNRPEAWRRLSSLVGRAGPGRLRFLHGLYQRVAYEGLSFRRRREIHLALSQELERRGAEPAILSLHFGRAEDHERAYRWSAIAARQAAASHANAEAAELYRRALTSAARLPEFPLAEAAELAERLGDVLELNADYEAAMTAYGDARRWTSDDSPRDVARLLRKLGVIRERTGAYPEALRWYTRAMRLLGHPPDGPPTATTEDEPDVLTELAELELAYAGVRHRQGDAVSARAWTDRAIEHATSSGHEGALGHAYYLSTLIQVALGDPRARETGERALPLLEQTGDLVEQAKLLNNLGIAAYFAGDWDVALDYYERSRRASHRAGDLVSEATVVNNIGEILSDRGCLDDAVDLFEQALATFETARYPIGAALATSNLGRARQRAGELASAATLLEEARSGFEAINAAGFVADTLVRIAEVHVDAGQPAAALDALEQAERSSTSPDPFVAAATERVRASALLALGRLDEAAVCASSAVRRAEQAEALFERARALQVRTAVRRAMAAEAELDEAEAHAALDRLGVTARTP